MEDGGGAHGTELPYQLLRVHIQAALPRNVISTVKNVRIDVVSCQEASKGWKFTSAF